MSTQRIAYAVFADNGNIVCFSSLRDHPSLKSLEAEGCEVVALAPQRRLADEQLPIAVAALENDCYVITGIEDRCLKALEKRKGPRGTALIELYPRARFWDMTADTFLTLTGEITSARNTLAQLTQKAIALCDAVENKDDLPLTKYALRAARLVSEVRELANEVGRAQSGSPEGLDSLQREASQ